MKKNLFCLFLYLLSIISASAENAEEIVLASGSSVTDILIDSNDNHTVLFWTGIFAEDIERVSGQKPAVRHNPEEVSENCIIIGSIEESGIIRDLVRRKLLDVSEIRGKWEASVTQIIENPYKNVKKALVIAGSDRRGTVYAALDISRQAGVSPWYWFADVHPVKKEEIRISMERKAESTDP